MYAYTIYASLEQPKGVSEQVGNLMARAPGSIKEITVRLLTAEDEDLLGPSDLYHPLSELRAEVTATDEKVKKMVLEQLSTSFRDKVSTGKELSLEYDVRVVFFILGRESKILLDTFGPLVPSEDARALALAKELGDVKGYTISQIRDVKVVSVEEEPDSVFAFVIVNPSHEE